MIELEREVKERVLEMFQNAVRDSIEVGVTPNWLLISPALCAYVSPDIVKFSGMRVWRSPNPLPENRFVIAIRLSTQTVRDENGV